jgi:serine/threonine protein phosphatase PrpC
MSLKILQLHKRDSYEFKFIQDKVSYTENQKCFAVADGTTQSFRSEVWAEIVTNAFINTPALEPESLIKLFGKSAEGFRNLDFKLSDNPAKASLERTKLSHGATATFIGAKLEDNNQLSIVSLGDSNLFILRNNELQSFPFKSVDELDRNNHFLNTEKFLSNEVEPEFFQRTTVQLADGDLVILATDALSRLLLKDRSALDRLLQIQDFDGFHNFCLDYWSKRELEEDDITALIYSNDTSDKTLSIVPPHGFSFPKKEEKEFTPSFGKPKNSQTNNDEMQYFTDEINRLDTELILVRNKAKRQSILLFIILGLLSLSILFRMIPESFKIQANSVREKLYQFREEFQRGKNTDRVQVSFPLTQGDKRSKAEQGEDMDDSEGIKETETRVTSENKSEEKPSSSNTKAKINQSTTKDKN